jgi:hypothetical protein
VAGVDAEPEAESVSAAVPVLAAAAVPDAERDSDPVPDVATADAVAARTTRVCWTAPRPKRAT